MAKITKIDLIRNELGRIASAEDRRDLVSPTMKACWSFTRVMVIGKIQRQLFDYDVLKEFLKNHPTGSGEDYFWSIVNATNFKELAEKMNRNVPSSSFQRLGLRS